MQSGGCAIILTRPCASTRVPRRAIHSFRQCGQAGRLDFPPTAVSAWAVRSVLADAQETACLSRAIRSSRVRFATKQPRQIVVPPLKAEGPHYRPSVHQAIHHGVTGTTHCPDLGRILPTRQARPATKRGVPPYYGLRGGCRWPMADPAADQCRPTALSDRHPPYFRSSLKAILANRRCSPWVLARIRRPRGRRRCHAFPIYPADPAGSLSRSLPQAPGRSRTRRLAPRRDVTNRGFDSRRWR